MNSSPTRASLSLVKEMPQIKAAETMSSREIAELYGKRHDDVLKKIRKLEPAYVEAYGGLGKFAESSYINLQNKEQPEILLNKSQALFVASRFDAVLHAKVQKRWEELESHRQKAIRPVDPVALVLSMDKSQILQLAAEQQKQIEHLEKEHEVMQPKAVAFDRLALAEGSHCVTDSAKMLGVQPKKMFAYLQEIGWIFRRHGGKGWLGYQDKVQQGLVTHKITTVIDVYTGQEKVKEQVLITPKGLARLALFLEGGHHE